MFAIALNTSYWLRIQGNGNENKLFGIEWKRPTIGDWRGFHAADITVRFNSAKQVR